MNIISKAIQNYKNRYIEQFLDDCADNTYGTTNMEKWINSGKSLDVKLDGYNPLLSAASNDNFRAVEILLKHKTDWLEERVNGYTALLLSSTMRGKCIESLVKAGANINAVVESSGNVNGKDKGQSAIMNTLGWRCFTKFLFLHDNGADLSLINSRGKSLFDLFVENLESDTCKVSPSPLVINDVTNEEIIRVVSIILSNDKKMVTPERHNLNLIKFEGLIFSFKEGELREMVRALYEKIKLEQSLGNKGHSEKNEENKVCAGKASSYKI